jgi:hypothetical protein
VRPGQRGSVAVRDSATLSLASKETLWVICAEPQTPTIKFKINHITATHIPDPTPRTEVNPPAFNEQRFVQLGSPNGVITHSLLKDGDLTKAHKKLLGLSAYLKPSKTKCEQEGEGTSCSTGDQGHLVSREDASHH